MSLLRVIAAILATAALAGCAAAPREERAEAPAPQAVVNAPYRLASGDRLRILVFGQNDLTNSYNVDSSGAVSMPLIGRLPAQGLTTAELERMVAARLRQGYIRDPSVSIEVEDFRPFFILGAVCSAGRYPFISGMTVQQAVAVAGGFAPRAFETSVDITRTVDGRTTTFAAPLAYPVRPGDTITVGSGLF
nr:polysaccharide biosynthesis/export family protein [Roseiarcus fermentans]